MLIHGHVRIVRRQHIRLCCLEARSVHIHLTAPNVMWHLFQILLWRRDPPLQSFLVASKVRIIRKQSLTCRTSGVVSELHKLPEASVSAPIFMSTTHSDFVNSSKTYCRVAMSSCSSRDCDVQVDNNFVCTVSELMMCFSRLGSSSLFPTQPLPFIRLRTPLSIRGVIWPSENLWNWAGKERLRSPLNFSRDWKSVEGPLPRMPMPGQLHCQGAL